MRALRSALEEWVVEDEPLHLDQLADDLDELETSTAVEWQAGVLTA